MATQNAGVLAVAGGHLSLAGHPYRDVGVNAYEIATEWGVNAGCGTMLTDAQLDSFFASLAPHTLVRFWAWQGTIADSIQTGQIDWQPLDRVFAAASAHDDLLIVSLASPDGSCDDNHWKDPAWYEGGYMQAYGPTSEGLRPISYWDYVKQIVSRYSGSPALGMWEPISEPEASTCLQGLQGHECSGHQLCPSERSAAQALRTFFDTVGAEIHQLDDRHLVESGFLGSGQCGTSGPDFDYVGASPGIDVLSYHDYYPADVSIGGDQWNGIQVRASQAGGLRKPLIAGEMGIIAGLGEGCTPVQSRVADLTAKIRAQSAAGVDAFLLWNWTPSAGTGCTFDVGAQDPALALTGTQ